MMAYFPKKAGILLCLSVFVFPKILLGQEIDSGNTSDIEKFLTNRQELLEVFENIFQENQDVAGQAGKTIDSQTSYTLADLFEIAKKDNPVLQAQNWRSSAAHADLKAAKYRRLPTLTAEAGGQFTGNPIGTISLTKGQLGSFAGPDGNYLLPMQDMVIYKGMEETYYKFSLKTEIPLFTWGKITKGIDLARSALEVSELQKQAGEKELTAKIAASFDALLCLVQTRNILLLQIDISQRMLRIAEQNARAGFLTETELAKTKVKLSEIRLEYLRLQEHIASLLDKLAESLALDELCLEDLYLEDMSRLILNNSGPDISLQAALDIIPQNSLSLKQARTAVEIREKALALYSIQARGLPDIALQSELSYGGFRFPFIEKDWYRQDDWQFSLSIGTSGSILGNAAAYAAMQRAKAELAEARAVEKDGQRQLRSWIRARYANMDLLAEKLDYARLDQLARGGDLQRLGLELSSGSGSELDALQSLIEALSPLAQAWGDLAEYRGEMHALNAAQ